MKLTKNSDSFNSGTKLWTHAGIYLLISAVLAACGGGGGGGGAAEPPESAIVQTVVASQVLEGASGTTSQLEFLVTLDRPAVKGLDVIFSTASTAKTGIDTKEFAKSGASCSSGIDYVSAVNSKVSIAKGSSTAKLVVTVCGDNVFAPNKTLKINWTAVGSAGGSVIGTIVNDDAGGLNSTGATIVMGAVTAFGRDTNVLTNDLSDGALGFSFSKKPSAASWNCTDDNVSGLTWQRVNGITSTFADLELSVASANGAALCGYSDWRVPTVNELLSLVDSSRPSSYGAVNADREGVLEAAMNNQFWTKESRANGSVDAWFVAFSTSGSVDYALKSSVKGVRLVRGSANPVACNNSDSLFSDLGDSTVVDGRTGLMWKQCQEGSSSASCSAGIPLAFSGVPAVMDRLALVNSASSVSSLGYSDWRVPTKNELASLANRACTGGARIITSVFPATEPVSYISATVDANNPSQFWYVDFAEGSIGIGTSVANKRLRLVRAGQ